MAENTKIQWTDYTFNPWRGCTKVAEGCKFCYAEVDYSVKMHGIKWGPNGTRVKTSDSYWKKPLKWNREAEQAGERPRVFCASLADVFEEWSGRILDHRGNVMWHCDGKGVIRAGQCTLGNQLGERPATMADLRRDLFALIDATPHLDWILLTKRPENIRKMWADQTFESKNWFFDPDERKRRGMGDNVGPYKSTLTIGNKERPNVWLLTSIATQADWDRNIPELLKCRDLSPVLGISAEPLLEAVDLRPKAPDAYGMLGLYYVTSPQHPGDRTDRVENCFPRLDWIIAGGESGPNARPCDVGWIRSIVEQCKSASVPCFVKQLGARPCGQWESHHDPNDIEINGIRRLNDPKGGDISEWPEDLRVREFPKVEAIA